MEGAVEEGIEGAGFEDGEVEGFGLTLDFEAVEMLHEGEIAPCARIGNEDRGHRSLPGYDAALEVLYGRLYEEERMYAIDGMVGICALSREVGYEPAAFDDDGHADDVVVGDERLDGARNGFGDALIAFDQLLDG